MATATETILRRSICPACQAEGVFCPRCAGEGLIPTPAGERPDAIAIVRPLRRGAKGRGAFSVQLIVEPGPRP